MDLRVLTEKDKTQYNRLVTHVIQSWEWGEFRKSIGTKLKRYGLFEKGKMVTAFQITFHKIPLLNQYVGYLPKGPVPDRNLATALEKIGKEENCTVIKIEPNIKVGSSMTSTPSQFKLSPKPYFTKYNFVLDLTKSEEELLKNMHPKTRYNIKVSEKKGVKVEIRTDDKAFEMYIKLYFDTTKRQGYHGHNIEYHKKAWEIMKQANMARIAIGFYQKKPLCTWMLYNFQDKLYYPYGGSSDEHREVMASTGVCWNAIKVGKSLKLKSFDLWGALSPDAATNHPWQGFNRFKKGFGADLVEYVGTYDLIFNFPVYWAFTSIDKFSSLKFTLLKILSK